MLVIYAVVVVVIMKGESPIIMLLLLTLAWGILAGVPLMGEAGKDIISGVLEKGGTAYASAVVIIVFGAWFGQVLVKTHIAENIIRGAIELAGDRPVVVAIVISVVTTLLFTSIYGVGAAIAIGVIALPIMMSMGIPPRVATAAFTMALAAGLPLNLVSFSLFKPLFPGIVYAQPYLSFFLACLVVELLGVCAMCFYQLKIRGIRKYSAVSVAQPLPARVAVPWYGYAAPAVPVVLVIAFKWPMIPAFIVGIVYALLATHFGKRTLRETIDLFHRAFYDAFPDIATIAALWIICGMLIVCAQLPQVQKVLSPVFTPFLPKTPLGLAILFAALAPLSLYRGPFQVIGTGAALLAMFLNAKHMSGAYLYCAFIAPWYVGCSLDPTVSWNLWTIGYAKVGHRPFIQTGLAWAWISAAVVSFLAYFMVPRP
jgi:hypothetical protein